MNRRAFMQQLPLWTTPLWATAPSLLPRSVYGSVYAAPSGRSYTRHQSTRLQRSYRRHIAIEIDAPPLPFPQQKRVPLGLSAFAVPVPTEAGREAGRETGRSVEMRFAESAAIASAEPLHFRITAAIDFREEKTLRLYLPGSGQNIGVLQIKYAHPFQPFQTTIAPRWLPELRRQGLGLELSQGTQDAWFLLPEGLEGLRSGAEGLMPQLLSGGGPASEEPFRQRLYSMNSFSPFGWMGGCVQDALWELSLQEDPQAAQTLALHLGHYLDDQQGIVFENPRTRPLDGTFNSIEDFLPFAAIVNRYPDHPSVQKAVDFCLARRNAEGLILSGRHVTTEGCYTLAYPLAAIAQIRQDPRTSPRSPRPNALARALARRRRGHLPASYARRSAGLPELGPRGRLVFARNRQDAGGAAAASWAAASWG